MKEIIEYHAKEALNLTTSKQTTYRIFGHMLNFEAFKECDKCEIDTISYNKTSYYFDIDNKVLKIETIFDESIIHRKREIKRIEYGISKLNFKDFMDDYSKNKYEIIEIQENGKLVSKFKEKFPNIIF